MKTNYTRAEAYELAESLKEDFKFVRIVDPAERSVYELKTCLKTDEVCHEIWDRCERCENCTSCRAMQTHKMAFKLDIKDKQTYLVISKYITIEGRPMIMELISGEPDDLFIDSSGDDEVSCLINKYNKLIITDPLTDTYNRRFLDEHFVTSLSCCADNSIPLDIVILDVDDFKKINDTYGHSAGDAVLKDVAAYWRLHFDSREKDRERLVIRYGGDEFIIAARGPSLDEFTGEVMDAYREMRKNSISDGMRKVPFTMTFGIAGSSELGDDFTWDRLFELADRRLYENKSLMERSHSEE